MAARGNSRLGFLNNASVILPLDYNRDKAAGIRGTSQGTFQLGQKAVRQEFKITAELPRGFYGKGEKDSFAVFHVTVNHRTMSTAVKTTQFRFIKKKTTRGETTYTLIPYEDKFAAFNLEGNMYCQSSKDIKADKGTKKSYGSGSREQQVNVVLRGAAHLLSKLHPKYKGGEVALMKSLKIDSFDHFEDVTTIPLPVSNKCKKWVSSEVVGQVEVGQHGQSPEGDSSISPNGSDDESLFQALCADDDLSTRTDVGETGTPVHNTCPHTGAYAVDTTACDAAELSGFVSPENMLFVRVCDGVSLLKPVSTLDSEDTLGVVLKTLVCRSSSWPEVPNQHLEFYLSGYVDVRIDWHKLTMKNSNLLLTLGSQTFRTNFEVVGKSDNLVRCLHRCDAWEPITPLISNDHNIDGDVCSSPQSGASGDSEDDDADEDTRKKKKSRRTNAESQLGKRSHSKSRSNKTKLDKSGKHHGSRKHKQQLPDSELEDRVESNYPKVQSPKMSGKPTSDDVQESDLAVAVSNEGSQTGSISEGLTTSSTQEMSQQLEQMKLEEENTFDTADSNDDFTDPQTRRKETEDTLGDTVQPLDSPRQSFIAGYDSYDSDGDDSSAQSGHPASFVKRKGSTAVESPMFVSEDHSQELVDAQSSVLDESSLDMSTTRSSDDEPSQSGKESHQPRRKSMIGRLANRFSKLLSSSRGSGGESENLTQIVTKESDSLEELKKEHAVYVVGENDDIVQQLKTQLSSSQFNVSITESLTQATYVLLLVESALFATDEIREALDAFNEHNVQLVILYVSDESRNIESLLAKVPSKYKSLKDVEWIPYRATNKRQDDQHDAIVNALRVLDLDDTKIIDTRQDNSRSVDNEQVAVSNFASVRRVVSKRWSRRSSATNSRTSVSSTNQQFCEGIADSNAETGNCVEVTPTAPDVEDHHHDPYSEAYEQATAHERQILKHIIPIAQLAGAKDEETAKRFSLGTWDSLLSPRGVSVAALCILCNEVLRSQRAQGVHLVTLLEDMHDHKGQLVKKGRTIRLTASSKTSTTWKGKTSYAEGGILRFNPNQVSAVKPRAKWTIEDYCEFVVKSEVVDSKAFYLDEIDDKHVGPVGKGYYISQARSSTFMSLCDALIQYFDGQDRSQCFVWLDLFCTNQGLLTFGDASEEVQKQREDVLKHGLHHIMQQMDGGCLLFMDEWRKPAALGRAWVIWELLGVALTDTKFDIVLRKYASNESFDKMLSENIERATQSIMDIDVSKAQCANPSDLKYLQAKWNGHEDTVNNFVRNHLRKWFVVVAKQRGQLMLDGKEYNDEAGRLLDAAGRLLQHMGKYSEASPLFERSLAIKEKVHGPDHPSTSTTLNSLALVLQKMGKYSEALPLFERSLAIYENVHGPDHPSTSAGLNNLGLVLHDMGKYSEALPLFERSLAICEQIRGPDHPETSAGLNNLALVLRDMGKYGEALPLLERSLAIYEKVHGPDHPSTSTGLNNLAVVLQKMGKHSEALPLFERSLAILEKVHGPDHPSTSAGLSNLALVLRDMGKYGEALPLLERSLAIKERVHAPDHPETAIGLSNLAWALRDIGKYSEALPLFERSLAIKEKVHGPDHPSTSIGLNSLGLVLQDMGKYSEALPLFERSLAILEKVHGPDHHSISRGLSNLGLVLQNIGKYSEALPLFERSLAIKEKVHGPDHPSTSTGLSNLAFVLRDMGKYSEALPLFERSLAIYEKVHGPNHPLTSIAMSNLAKVLQDMGRYNEALPLFERSLAIEEMVHGPDHPSTSIGLSNLAFVLRDMGKYREVLPLFERSLAIREKVHGPDHPSTSTALNNLASVLHDMGRYREVLPLFERSLAIEEKVHGPDHPSTSIVLSSLASVLQDMGKYSEALPLFERSLAIYEKVHGPDHPSTSTALNNLASVLKDMGKYSEALPLFERSLAIYEKVHGPDHPSTSTALNNLASVLQDMGKYSEALPLFERSLAILEKVHGPDHPSTSAGLNNLASVLKDMGKYSEALPLFERSLAIDEKVYGPNHLYVGLGQQNLGDLFRRKNCYAKSEAMLQSGLSIIENAVGDSHTRTANVLLAIGKLRRVFGNKEEGVKVLKRARSIYMSTYSELHPRTLQVDHELALYETDPSVRKTKLKQVLARREQVLGHDHPHTIETREEYQTRVTQS